MKMDFFSCIVFMEDKSRNEKTVLNVFLFKKKHFLTTLEVVERNGTGTIRRLSLKYEGSGR